MKYCFSYDIHDIPVGTREPNSGILLFCSLSTCCGCCWWGWDFCPPCSSEAFLRYLSVASSTSETSCPIVAGSCNHSKSALIQHYNQCGITNCNMLYHNVSSSNYIKISSPFPIWPKALDMFRKRHPSLTHLWIKSVFSMMSMTIIINVDGKYWY